MQHLAIFTNNYIDRIFKGEKTIEVRFSKVKCAPFWQVKKGDEIFLKQSGEKVLGKMIAGKVESIDDLTPNAMDRLRDKYFRSIYAPDSFWKSKRSSRYATIIQIDKVFEFTSPIELDKHDRRSWVVLGDEKGSASQKLQLSLRFTDNDSLGGLLEQIKNSIRKDQWDKFNKPKDLILALQNELGELSGKYKWLTDEEVKNISKNPEKLKDISEKIANILVDLLILSDKLEIDLFNITKEQISKDKKKYSFEKLKLR